MSTVRVELHDADRAEHPHVGHARQAGGGRQPGPAAPPRSGRPRPASRAGRCPGRAARSSEALATAQASGLPMNVGPCASTGSSPRLMPVGDLGRAQRGRQRQVAAGQRLADAHHVRRHPGVLGREERAGAAEPGRDLVEDEQHAVRVARLPQHPQVAGVVEAHPARALDDRLDDHRGQLVGLPASISSSQLGRVGLVDARPRTRPAAARRRPAGAARRPTSGACRPRGRRPTSP